MAEVNAAYDLLRAGGFSAPPRSAKPQGGSAPARRARPLERGSRRPSAARSGRELLEALEDGEAVDYVTPTATWASARALLVVTDRRLLWLLDDVVMKRVDFVRFTRIASIDHHLRRPRRRVAILRVETVDGRRLTFSELRPQTAEAIVRRVGAGARGVSTERFDRRGARGPGDRPPVGRLPAGRDPGAAAVPDRRARLFLRRRGGAAAGREPRLLDRAAAVRGRLGPLLAAVADAGRARARGRGARGGRAGRQLRGDVRGRGGQRARRRGVPPGGRALRQLRQPRASEGGA